METAASAQVIFPDNWRFLIRPLPLRKLPEQVASVHFSALEKGSEPCVDPTVDFVPSEKRIRITGTMWAGNPCKEARLDSLGYDTQTDDLGILVAVKQVQSGTCPDSLGTNTYEVVIMMQSRLPATVTATHQDFQDKSTTTTASPPTRDV